MAALIAVHRGRRPLAEEHLTAPLPEVDHSTVAAFYEYLPLCAGVLLDEAQGDTQRAYSRLAEAFDSGVGHLPGQLILSFLTPDLVRLALAQGTMRTLSATPPPRNGAPTTAAASTTSVTPTAVKVC